MQAGTKEIAITNCLGCKKPTPHKLCSHKCDLIYLLKFQCITHGEIDELRQQQLSKP